MRFTSSVAAALPLALLASAHSVQPRASSPEIDAANAAALAKLRARHPQARAVVLGSDADFGQPLLRRQNRAAATGTAVGTINSAAIAAIGSTTSAEPNIPALATPTAGSPAPISGAPALPAATIVPSQWPALDKAPPTDSSFVQGLLAKLDLSKAPAIPVNNPGGCANASNAAAVAASATNAWWTCSYASGTRATDVVACPTTNTWGLSYDDGPSPDTPRLLQYMDAQSPQLKATMFVVGSRAISRPQMLQYEYLDGMQLCVHTWSHTALTTQTNEQIVAELGWTREAIRQIVGVSPTCMRPPYGDIDDRVRYIAGAMSMTPVIWTRANGGSFDTQDWQIGAGVVSATNVTKNFNAIISSASSLSTGFIVLEHDLYQQSVSIALDYVLPYALSQSNLRLQTVIECQGKSMSENYLETQSKAFNPTSTVVGSTGTGVIAIPVQSGSASSGSSGSGSSGSSGSTTANKGGAAALPAPLLFAAIPALAALARFA